jgi:hypothetical protein
MKSAIIASLASFLVMPAFGQELAVSDKYPLRAHIVSVEMQQEQRITDGTGGTSTWHLMKADIDGTTYGLSIAFRPFSQFRHFNWLERGFYPARHAGCGFEFEYMDGGKIRHEELCIMSEEDTILVRPSPRPSTAPAQEAAPSIETAGSKTSDANSGFPGRWKSMTSGTIRKLRVQGDYIYSELVVSEADAKAGVFQLGELKREGDKYVGSVNTRDVRPDEGASCSATSPIELTLVTPDRIEGRAFFSPPGAKLNWATCSYSPPADWQSFVWIPAR